MKNSGNNRVSDRSENLKVTDPKPMDIYDDGNIPQVDLPPKTSSGNTSKNVIPDEVPRKDGPGGEGGR